MMRPPGFTGVAFGNREAGDPRTVPAIRADLSARLGISDEWAFVHQIHSVEVRVVDGPGHHGDADGLVTTRPGLPLAVATADCAPVVIEAENAVAIVHAGWRGATAGIVGKALELMSAAGARPLRAAIGPAIGPCCYEVGPEVAAAFPGFVATTTWGTTSVDIPGLIQRQLGDLQVWRSPVCTYTSDRLSSWRRDHNPQRQIAVAWLPEG